MHDLKLEGKSESALNVLQQTNLTPMEEALFKSWTKANQITDADEPSNPVDYRGIYRGTGGLVLPNGELNRLTRSVAAESELERALHEQMRQKMQSVIETVQNKQDQAHKEMRQDMTHQQRMESDSMKLQKAPHDARMKQMDLDKQKMGLHAQRLGNEGKQLELAHAMIAPQQSQVTNATEPKKPNQSSSASNRTR